MKLTEKEQKKAAKEFVEYWQDKGDEKQETARFWIELLGKVLGVDNPTSYIAFEKPVMIDKNQKYIDGYISSSKVLIEQKSSNIKLSRSAVQSDGERHTPYGQAFRYNTYLPYDEKAKWIIVCNFTEILIYDMNKPNGEPEQILLKDLPKEFYRLQFLVDEQSKLLQKELELSFDAGKIVGKLYDMILKQYHNPDSEETLKSLNMLCVRLVFCLYAEDAEIFGQHDMFGNYLKQFQAKDVRKALIELFKVLDTKPTERDPYLDDDLSAFPYVNGGLFADEDIEIPRFTDEILDFIVNKASYGFDWADISPTIFGAVFESTLNPETRRSGGMHYTSIENIHKVINPLFLDELTAELEDIKAIKVVKTRKDKLECFRDKLSSLTFLDPACGSGNFLTETYISLRKLENEVLSIMYGGQGLLQDYEPIKVSIGQFYGIEINDFAVSVAKTALWIAESQMLKKTEEIMQIDLNFLPLKSYANIVEGNALRIDWESVVPKEKLSYIMGNPPFIGQSNRNKEQSNDMYAIFGQGNIITKQDYVLCWYKKALDYMNGTNTIVTGFVSTNSICQGEAVPTFWRYMVDNNTEIQFAYPSFIWDSEASLKAQVHCVIVGFTNYSTKKQKLLISDGIAKRVSHINGYLLNAPNIWLENRTNKKGDTLPKMTTGSPPTDDGGLLLTVEEKNELISKYPILQKYVRPFIGAKEFLHDKIGTFSRYCLWFKDGNPTDYVKIKQVSERLERVRNLRKSSNADRIQKMADYPYLFCQIRQPNTTYLVIPRHSSEKRKYIPIGFISPDIIVGDACSIVPNMSIYQFGIMTSNVHMAWVKNVCGRLEMRYRYSPSVYNNFPWCNPTPEQKAKIEQTAQAILDARAKYPDCSLADLYDELTMPPELRKAHQLNDFAVMSAYGFDKKISESECVAELMKMYQKLVQKG